MWVDYWEEGGQQRVCWPPPLKLLGGLPPPSLLPPPTSSYAYAGACADSLSLSIHTMLLLFTNLLRVTMHFTRHKRLTGMRKPILGVWCTEYPLTHFILETPKGVLAKSADPDQMPHNVASDLGLHYFASCSTIFQQKYLN